MGEGKEGGGGDEEQYQRDHIHLETVRDCVGLFETVFKTVETVRDCLGIVEGLFWDWLIVMVGIG